MRKQKGITIVSLVVTIIVLIILAGVSINAIIGENGIITIAKEAKENMELAQVEEQTKLNELYTQITDEGSGSLSYDAIAKLQEFKRIIAEAITNKGVETSETDTAETMASNIEKIASGGNNSEIVEWITNGTRANGNKEIEDILGNKFVIPDGFKIAIDSGVRIEEGIVIEDNDIIEGIGNNRGNQYVWIPVGKGLKKSDGTTVDIELGRYTFATDGTETLVQSAENYLDETVIGTYYKELVTSRTGVASSGLDGLNTTALNLKGFIDSVKANGGYYIARYEASYGTDGKANSKVSNSYSQSTVPTTEGTLWNFISQINATTASRDLYTTVTSDLINSYAWDTAIVYIQKFSGDIDYSRQNSLNTSLANTGINGDEVCKINDMASNIREWTTENSTYTYNSKAYPCNVRGGYCHDSGTVTAYRDSGGAASPHYACSFRSALYL